MNLTGRGVYQKGDKANKKPTQQQRVRWGKIVLLGCLARCNGVSCGNKPEIHHALTGAGGRKDHGKVIPLCPLHHRGAEGIHKLSRAVWEPIFGGELDLLIEVEQRLKVGTQEKGTP